MEEGTGHGMWWCEGDEHNGEHVENISQSVQYQKQMDSNLISIHQVIEVRWHDQWEDHQKRLPFNLHQDNEGKVQP